MRDRERLSQKLDEAVVACTRCPRLTEHCQQVAREKRRAYRDDDYWGKPVPGFGSIDAELLVVGLAPGAHGANRTGRLFTGDATGRVLYQVLYDNGFASRPESAHREDGLRLINTRLTNIVRCAPPQNKPKAAEVTACREHLLAELQAMERLRVAICLGKMAFDGLLAALKDLGETIPSPKPKFGHDERLDLPTRHLAPSRLVIIASYHPSQQNVNTGVLTPEMLSDIFQQAWECLWAAG